MIEAHSAERNFTTQFVDIKLDMNDPVLADIRKLREGRGLTSGRLKQRGALMSALGTSDPQVALERFTDVLGVLDDTPWARALKVDLGCELKRLLERAPVPDEIRLLGQRRASYSLVVQKDVKTLGRWSDRAAEDLRAQLIDDTFSGTITVIAAVDEGRIAGVTTILEDPKTGKRKETDEWENTSLEVSLPCLIYGFPRDWKPSSLRLAVAFRRAPVPERIWAVVAATFFDLACATERHELPVQDNMVMARIDEPRRDRLYGVFWRD